MSTSSNTQTAFNSTTSTQESDPSTDRASEPRSGQEPESTDNEPAINILSSGALGQPSSCAKEMLKNHLGAHRLVSADSLLLLVPDHNTGTAPIKSESLIIAGNLKEMSLIDLLSFLGQIGATGRLVIKEGARERVIVLVDGGVTAVATNQEQERFGQFVSRLTPITEEELDIAASKASREGSRIGQTLLRLGLIDNKTLLEAIRAQIAGVITGTMHMHHGSFVFYRLPDHDAHLRSALQPLQMQSLLLEASRCSDETARTGPRSDGSQ